MFGFCIVNLIIPEREFEIPSAFGTWAFRRSRNYEELSQAIEQGACGNTFEARINIDFRTRTEAEFGALCDEIIAAGLLL